MKSNAVLIIIIIQRLIRVFFLKTQFIRLRNIDVLLYKQEHLTHDRHQNKA
jgi:hypothetical protein